MTRPAIFIDGEAGTTGLEIRERLAGSADVELLTVVADRRKDVTERRRLLNACDLAILCLPDDAAREAVALIDNPRVKVIDASTAHRTAPGWVYGLPELNATQVEAIRAATRVANPGCYPTGAIALLRPLVDAGLLPSGQTVTVNAISGYSGGGKELIVICEDAASIGQGRNQPFALYGLDQAHKHLPEMRQYSGLIQEPLFLPSYSNAFYRGMLVHIVLRLRDFMHDGPPVDGATIHAALSERYAGQRHIKVQPLIRQPEPRFVLSPLACNETNDMQLSVIWNAAKQTVVLAACLDNLGKGAAGAAVQNAELMLGLN